MLRISTRDDLLEYVCEHAPSSGVRRAIDDGRYEVLGAFAALPPHTMPGWIVKVTSKHGSVWPVAVAVNEVRHRYEVYILDDIPWSLYDGGKRVIYAGDHPNTSARKRNLARMQK